MKMFEGVWYISEMSNWGQEYMNMEVRAYIQLDELNDGCFQFGLCRGDFLSKKRVSEDGRRVELRFIGTDELDPCSGQVWISLMDEKKIQGEFIFDQGEESTFLAVKG